MPLNYRQLILLAGDAALLYISLTLALTIRNQAFLDQAVWQAHWPLFSVIFLIWLAVFYIAGLYTLSELRKDLKFYVNATRVIGINFLLSLSFFYVLPAARITPKTILVLTILIFFVLFIGWRYLLHRYIYSQAAIKKVLLVGDNATARELINLFKVNPQIGYEASAILAEGYSTYDLAIPHFQNFSELEHIIKRQDIDTIIFDNQSKSSETLVKHLFDSIPSRLEFFSLSAFYENIAKKVSLEAIDQIWFLENLRESNKKLFDAGKRIIDLAGAAAGLVFSLMLAPLISIVIWLSSGRPIFFTQIRVSRGGKRFRAVKFRTMRSDAEKNGPQWAQANDARVTPAGRFLRKTRLDEIPQLWNIIKGEMSFVGPRPERPEFVKELEKTIPFYSQRLLVKPGLSGWAQVNYPYGVSVEDAKKKLQYDLYYVKNRSLVLDLAIILKTIKTVLSAVGH